MTDKTPGFGDRRGSPVCMRWSSNSFHTVIWGQPSFCTVVTPSPSTWKFLCPVGRQRKGRWRSLSLLIHTGPASSHSPFVLVSLVVMRHWAPLRCLEPGKCSSWMHGSFSKVTMTRKTNFSWEVAVSATGTKQQRRVSFNLAWRRGSRFPENARLMCLEGK